MLSKFPKWVLTGAGILAFVSGAVNTIAILGFTHHAATHLTGLFSQAAIELFENQTAFLEISGILISFFAGAVITGIILHDAHLKMGQHYEFIMFLECALLILAALGFQRQILWGEYCAAMAAGLQNAMASTYSGAIIRTTHLTGVVTDLGVLIGHKLGGVPADNRRIKLFVTLISMFLAGGISSVWIYSFIGPWTMLVPAAIIGACGLIYRILRAEAQPKPAA